MPNKESRNDSRNHSSHRNIHRCTDLLLAGCSSLDLGEDEMIDRDNIIRMALETGMMVPTSRDHTERLERFAALVAAGLS